MGFLQRKNPTGQAQRSPIRRDVHPATLKKTQSVRGCVFLRRGRDEGRTGGAGAKVGSTPKIAEYVLLELRIFADWRRISQEPSGDNAGSRLHSQTAPPLRAFAIAKNPVRELDCLAANSINEFRKAKKTSYRRNKSPVSGRRAAVFRSLLYERNAYSNMRKKFKRDKGIFYSSAV